MNVPEELLYTVEHEWVSLVKGVATIGITDYAQSELGDIVFVELPGVGDETQATKAFGTVEAVKAVSELFAPLSGEVMEVNGKLEDQPELINNDPYGNGWIIKVKISDESEADQLLSADDYQKEVGG